MVLGCATGARASVIAQAETKAELKSVADRLRV
jgi:hypothetical protein